MTSGHVIIKPQRPNLPGLRFDLVGDADYAGGVGGWESLDRPRRPSATGWVGIPAVTLSLPLMLNGLRSHPFRSVESQCRTLRHWGRPTKTGEPAILRVTGPLQTTASDRWVIQDISWGLVYRNERGHRIQQTITVSLLQYFEPRLVLGPAKRARNRKDTKKGPKGPKGKDWSTK